jgi:hypothetical protein
MAFGLTGAPRTFQRAMNSTLALRLRKFVLVFFDDILVYSASFQEHLHHLDLVFQWLATDQWRLKLSKCRFAQREIAYLGHVISERGISTDPAKITAISSWPTPASVRALRGFLGLAGYYRKFIRHFGLIAKPLTDLLRKDTMFIWTSVHESAFQSLKAALCSAPVLGIPDFSKTFHIETDASGYGVGAVLLQDGHPLAFISKALAPRNQGLSAYEKEYLAIIMAVEQWRHYLLQAEFIIHTDHRSLVHLNEQRLHTPWQQKVFTKLLGLRYRVVYRRGVDNQAAHALSRRALQLELAVVSSPVHTWMHDLQQWYQSDTEARQIMMQLLLDPASRPPYKLQNGIIMYRGRIWLGQNIAFQSKVLAALHDSPVGVIQAPQPLCRNYVHYFSGRACVLLCSSMSRTVRRVLKQSLIVPGTLGCFSLFLCRVLRGR